MNSGKERSPSQNMKPGPEEMRSKARGEFSKAAFTNGEAGPFSKKYLSGESIYERLQGDETAHYLLVNKSKGVTIYPVDNAGDSKSMTADSSYRSVMLVSDCRILFALGGDEDTILEINAGDITGADFQSDPWEKHITVTTESNQYKFPVSIQESSDHKDAVGYIQADLVPRTSTTETGGSSDSSHKTAGQNGPSKPQFVATATSPSEETRDALEEATERLGTVDPSADDLKDAIEIYEFITEALENNSNEDGVSTETVDQTLTQANRTLEKLTNIRSVKIKINRKLVLAENGIQIPDQTLRNLRESVDDAISDAESLKRSTAELEQCRKQVVDCLDCASSGKADRTETESLDGPENTSTENTEKDENMPADQSSGSTPTEPDRTDLIEELHRLDEEFKGSIGVSHVRKRSQYPVSAYLQEFGSWKEIFKTAIQEESDQETQKNESVDSSSKDNQATRKEKEPTQEEASPTREDVISSIERVSEELGKRPTTSEFNTHSHLNISDVYRHFDSWVDAFGEASLDTLSRQDLLDELHRLSAELGFPPLSSHVDKHSQYSAYDYRQAFGSVSEAVEEAGLSVEGQVRETLRKLVAESDGNPKMADFEAESGYSAGVIYKFFDSWDDALSEVSSKRKDKQRSGETETIVQNELSERYELVRYLQKLCITVLDVRQDQLDDEGVDDLMVRWADKVAEFWKGEATETDGYGTQHAERNSFSMREYREEFGNGDWVTEFVCVRARQSNPTMQALFRALSDEGPNEIYLPVDEQTGDTFPVIVDSEEELGRAVEMLERLPTKPASAENAVDGKPEDDGTGENEPGTTTGSGELQDVNGVTDTIRRSLHESGFDTRSDLKKASVDELTDLEGLSEQIAMRIKLDVGG